MRARTMVLLSLALLTLGALLVTTNTRADEIGYIEDFVLAEDRQVALDQLIPGTEEYYYYHCLHLQHLGQFDQVDQLLERWIQQHDYTERVRKIQNRQMLLTYNQNPQRTIDYLIQRLDLHFNHQRESSEDQPDLPTALDPQRISRETLARDAFNRYSNLQGFRDSALDWLIRQELNPQQRRHLLERLQRPDYPNLVQLILDDLNTRGSRGFGSMPIHHQLLLEQLNALLEADPTLKNDDQFVRIYLIKLQPPVHVDWRNDPKATAEYLERMWQFVSQLNPGHNSLKANILYHWLDVDRALGIYSKERFLTYLKLPRPVVYVPRPFLERPENRNYLVDLNMNPADYTQFGPIISDEPLVRDYLMHFFVDETTYRPYEPYIDTSYLRHVFAETKLLYGIGDAEQWYAMLPPGTLQAIKDRIELDFVATNPQVFASDANVALELDVKNVSTLLVKVFEINALNYYRSEGREVNTDINLDGLVANHEQTYRYEEPPLRRMRRRFEFPEMKSPGIYVVDFIGNGKNSRVVVRKGKLDFLSRMGSAGHVFTILDDHERLVPDATLWMGGRAFHADDRGRILVPYTTNPSRGTEAIIVSRGNWASLHHFEHHAESYELRAGIEVDRESLLEHNEARVIVRPRLLVNGTPISTADLEEVALHITTTDVDGIESQLHVQNFELHDDRESVHSFHVPSRLQNVSVTLTAQIKVLSTHDTVDLSASHQIAVNGIDKTDKLAAAHLVSTPDGYLLEYLGKSGEPRPNVPAQLVLEHRDFEQPVAVTLQTDDAGRITLGLLPGIVRLHTNFQGTQQKWTLRDDQYDYGPTLHAAAREVIRVPFMESKAIRSEVSLLELRGESFFADRFDTIEGEPGFLELRGLEPGDYDLWLKSSDQRMRIRVAQGPTERGYVLGEFRKLEKSANQPLQITGAQFADDALVINVAHPHDAARIHVIATRYYPRYSPFDALVVPQVGPSAWITPSFPSLYMEGRDIGDEYRYIIDRRFAPRLPGNMMDRPSLLLNPWAIRDTKTEQQQAAEGEAMPPAAEAPTAQSLSRSERGADETTEILELANLDFLKDASVVLANLRPNEQGQVRIPLDDLGPHQQVHILAVDPETTAYRVVHRELQPASHVDLRLADTLDPEKHFAQQKQIDVVAPGESMVIEDMSSSRLEVYDSLRRVYGLYRILGSDQRLSQFEFVLDWPTLSTEEKQEKYSEFASHELHFFLYHKDPTFFAEVVRPYLDNKMDKTFLDKWLLDEDLSMYLLPWHFDRLNVVEQSLLARRVAEQRSSIAKDIEDRWELLPRDMDRWNVIFETALGGSALDRPATPATGMGGMGGQAAFGIEPARPRSRMADSAPPAPAMNDAAASGEAGAPRDEARDQNASRQFSRDGALGKLMESDRLGFEYKKAQLYQQLDKTKEWVENNYFKLPIEQQVADLVKVNMFWNEFVQHDAEAPFRSVHFAHATGNLTEMMFALSVLDLPFESPELSREFVGPKLTLTAKEPLFVFHEQIMDSMIQEEETQVLVSQNFFRADDRYEVVQGERHDQFVSEEFLVHVVYGCQIVVTNPTSSQQKVNVLLQIPEGALPVLGGRYTRGVMVDLMPYHTQTVEYYFYFPQPGEFAHYPVHVSKEGTTIAFVEPATFDVVERPSSVDKSSWHYISQHGTTEEVLQFLREENLHKIDLERIAFRLQDKDVFQQVIDVLNQRHAYNHTLWSYAIKHNVPEVIREFLPHVEAFVNQTGLYLESPLLTINPVLRHTYQHRDYRPLVNARAHALGKRRQIVNDRFHQQYHELLEVLSLRPNLNDEDRMELTAYLLLQDRAPEAMDVFEHVDPEQLDSRLQFDYFVAYLDCFNESPTQAAEIAARYADYPVDRWRESFAAIQNLVNELQGSAVEVANEEDLIQRQTQLASNQPNVELTVVDSQVHVAHANVKSVQLNFYEMDLELLFSRQPFVQQSSEHFSYIRPNATHTLEVETQPGTATVSIPESLDHSNVLVEVVADGVRRVQTHYANRLNVQMIESFGQVRVTTQESHKPLPKVYVKVYAQMQDGSVQFYKDGYTDIRGRFDYTSLSTDQLDRVSKFALLIVSDERGATVRDAEPPAR